MRTRIVCSICPRSIGLENFAAMDGRPSFADVRLAWNELGMGFQVEVQGQGAAAARRCQPDPRFRRRHAVAGHARCPHQPSGQPLLPPVSFPAHRRRPRSRRAGIRPNRDPPRFTGRTAVLAGVGGVSRPSKKTGYLVEAFLTAAAIARL